MHPAEGEQLLLRIDPLVGRVVVVGGRRREAAGDQHVVAERDHGDPQPGEEQRPELLPRHVGDAWRRQPGRHRADDGDTTIFHVEDHADDGRRGDGDQRRRPARTHEVDREEQPERAHADGECRHVGVVDDLEERAHLGDEVVAVDGGAGHPAQLADDHQHGGAGEVADEQRLRQQVGDHAETGEPADQTPPSDDQAERGTQRHRLLGITTRQRGDRRAGHQGDRRLRPHREHPRRADRGVHDERRQGGPQPGDGRHPDERCVGHDLGHQVGDDGDPGEEVRPQPADLVSPEHADSRCGGDDGLQHRAIRRRRQLVARRRAARDHRCTLDTAAGGVRRATRPGVGRSGRRSAGRSSGGSRPSAHR